MKKNIVKCIITFCFALTLIGESYGQDLKIVDEDSFTMVLNSLKKGDFFYNVEAQNGNIGFRRYANVYGYDISEKLNIFFTKRNLQGQIEKKIKIGFFYHYEKVDIALYYAKLYYYYNIIESSNNEFTVSFVNDSIISEQGFPYYEIITKQYFKICKIKEQANFSASTVYYDSLSSHIMYNQSYNDRYNVRNVNVTSNNNTIFTKSDYNNLDSTYTLRLLMVNNNGNLLHSDSLFKSKTNYQTFTFINNDTIIVLTNDATYQHDSLTFKKYNNDMQLCNY
ncbi:MAG: hypothetical protein IPL21_07510 [Saprospirales bacterium]|nr:hypothetical protein [Saprospirales bacterium]